MFDEFLTKYRNLRKNERTQRDAGYNNAVENYTRQANQPSSGNFGDVLRPVGANIAAGTVRATQALDNAGRGVNDFFSAWRDAMNGGHGKISPKTKDAQTTSFRINVDDSVVDVKDGYGETEKGKISQRKYRVVDEDTGKERTIFAGFKTGGDGRDRIATIYDESIMNNDIPVSGAKNLANYFKKNFSLDSGKYRIVGEDGSEFTYDVSSSNEQFNPRKLFGV